jgi:DNA-binding response OmpR family regulator
MHGAGLRQPILMPMALDKEMDRAASLEAGADDNVAKSHRFQERTAQVQARLRRAYGELALAARGSGSVAGTRRWTWSPSR